MLPSSDCGALHYLTKHSYLHQNVDVSLSERHPRQFNEHEGGWDTQTAVQSLAQPECDLLWSDGWGLSPHHKRSFVWERQKERGVSVTATPPPPTPSPKKYPGYLYVNWSLWPASDSTRGFQAVNHTRRFSQWQHHKSYSQWKARRVATMCLAPKHSNKGKDRWTLNKTFKITNEACSLRARDIRCNHHHHLSLNCEGRWGTTDDFTTSFLHFSLFSTALWDLATWIFPDVVFPPLPLSALSSSPFTVPCKMFLARPDERETWPYHCSLRLFMIVRRSPCGPIACWLLARTSSLVTWSLYKMLSILQ